MFRKPARREPRFDFRKNAVVQISMQTAEGQLTAVAQGHLCDISRGGAKLIVDEPVALQSSVVMRLSNTELHLDLEITGEVCWMVPAPDEGFAIGCTFVPDLPGEILEKLFSTGLLERRIFRRRALKVSAVAKWELEATATDAFLWDLSEGGFCVLSPLARKPGRRLLLTVEAENGRIEIPAKTQWELKVGDGYVVGCEFVNKDGYLLLRDLEQEATEVAPATPLERRAPLARKFRALVDSLLKSPAS